MAEVALFDEAVMDPTTDVVVGMVPPLLVPAPPLPTAVEEDVLAPEAPVPAGPALAVFDEDEATAAVAAALLLLEAAAAFELLAIVAPDTLSAVVPAVGLFR